MATVMVWRWRDDMSRWRRAAAPDTTRPSGVPVQAQRVEQDAEAWWEEIAGGAYPAERRYLAWIAVQIGDGRHASWTVSRRQLRKALAQLGLSDAVAAYVQSMPSEDRMDWDEAMEYDRYHPLVTSGLAALGMSEAQADVVWALAEGM